MIYKVCLILFIFLGLKQSLSEAVITYLNPPFGIKSFILRWSFYTELQISLCYKHSQKSLVPDLFTAFNLIDVFSAYCIGFCFLLVYLITQSLLLYEVGANSLLCHSRQYLHFKSGYYDYFKNSGSCFFLNHRGSLYFFPPLISCFPRFWLSLCISVEISDRNGHCDDQ